MGAYSEADLTVIGDVLRGLYRHQAFCELAAATWRRIPGHAWRADRWDESGRRWKQLIVEISDEGLFDQLDQKSAHIEAILRDIGAKLANLPPATEDRTTAGGPS